jgi:replication initiation and membrane attachment protein DnaB
MALVLSMAATSFAEDRTVTMLIPELCASNFSDVSSIFEGFKDIANFELDVENTLAVVTYNEDSFDLEALKKSLEGIEVPVKSVETVK